MDDDSSVTSIRDIDALRAKAASAETVHPATYQGASPIKIRKLGHLVYEVSDVERSVRFWTEVMGFTESDRNERGMVFLRCNADHHGIGLKPAKKTRRPDSEAGLMVEHLAFEVENPEVLIKARDYLKANGFRIVSEGRKGAGCNIALNFLDPDGHEFEIYCSMDQVGPSGRTRPPEQFRRASTLEEALANPVSATWE
jgi:catechol 2,3-dioxygenase-like lactoylglutathione lyase family enzyme